LTLLQVLLILEPSKRVLPKEKYVDISINHTVDNNKKFLNSYNAYNLFKRKLYNGESIQIIIDGLVVFSKN